jgi:hypothetical protein
VGVEEGRAEKKEYRAAGCEYVSNTKKDNE